MSRVDAIDVSQWQGNIDFGAVPQPIVIMKASGGDAGLYTDSKCYQYYDQAKHQHGKTVGLYHFAGGGNATAEANYFVQACQPLEKFDVFVLDWEIQNPNPVGWCNEFIDRVHALTGCYPLIYMNLSTLRSYNWDSVLAKSGLWVAAWTYNVDTDVNTGGKTYVMHQWSNQGSVPGIAGRVDLDAWYGTLDQFKKYGYQANDTPTPPKPVITTKDETVVTPVPFEKTSQNDPELSVGQTKVVQAGIDGVRTQVFTVTYTDGVETGRVVKSDTVTTQPVTEITAIGTKEPTPTPDPTPSDKGKVILGAFLAGVAAVVAWIISLLN